MVAVTGTNGKTTTSRMIGYIAQRAGMSVGWSSTDGVYVNGELVEAGDYSGPSGAGQVLRQPGVELAVTETARGGILRRGVGVAYNDVSVVTNISADHLGLGGIDTLDQLAEVKAVITKITKPTGLVRAERGRSPDLRHATGHQGPDLGVHPRPELAVRPCRCSTTGGRVTTVIDGWVAVLAAGSGRAAGRRGRRRADDPGRAEPGQRGERAGRHLGHPGPRASPSPRWPTGCASFDPGENNPGRMNIWTLPVWSAARPSAW